MSLQLTITAKGQVTLRTAVLQHLGVRPGQKIDVALLPDGKVELRTVATAPTITHLKAVLQRPGQRPITLAEMQNAIEQHDPCD
jgi:bifunctional DNA-binding transcriptional regulator/antitoxin component of YhaV-PrlF toxin-antitoxin module